MSFAVASAQAAALCGDADGNDAVTVTDGILTLRAAAELQSPCSLEACDIDRDGDTTLADGVNVLRIAAGLPVDHACSRDLRFASTTLDLIDDRSEADANAFFVYRDADDGLNKGFPSGFFGKHSGITIDAACLFDPKVATGCTDDEATLDVVRGTVLRVSLPALLPGEFAGLSFVEPEGLFRPVTGAGYDLTGSTHVEFDVASLDGAEVQFGVAGCVTPFQRIADGGTFVHRRIELATLIAPPLQPVQCPPTDLSNVTILFTVVTNDQHAPDGATVFLDDIRFTPAPPAQGSAVSFPIGTQTFGSHKYAEKPFASDQVLRNLTTIYESAIALQALAIRSDPRDRENVRRIAEAFDYALRHDNHGLPIPPAPDGARGLHSGYSSGDLALRNDQDERVAAGQVRLAGFSAGLCTPSNFCLVLDGATGGNNAFAIVALLQAYDSLGDPKFLSDALEIGRWIVGALKDPGTSGFGGYFLGYPDEGRTKGVDSRQEGKSVENNADIFSALLALSRRDPSNRDFWSANAKHAGDFAIAMFDPEQGRFAAGTVPDDLQASPGISPDGARRDHEVINTFDFLDSQTFTTLAMAESADYRNAIDWRRPIRHAAERFSQTANKNGELFEGFNISKAVAAMEARNAGIAWEFTGQMVVALRLVDREFLAPDLAAMADHYVDEIRHAQAGAPFGDGRGLVAATIDGPTPRPVDQCLDTPFQCIPERVGLAASAWAVFADADVNPLSPSL